MASTLLQLFEPPYVHQPSAISETLARSNNDDKMAGDEEIGDQETEVHGAPKGDVSRRTGLPPISGLGDGDQREQD
jgi:hypothetical protein